MSPKRPLVAMLSLVLELPLLPLWVGEISVAAVPFQFAGKEAGPSKAAGGEAVTASPSQTEKDWGPEVRGRRASVFPAKKQSAVGEPVTVNYVMKNFSGADKSVWNCGFWPNHKVVVPDAAGNEAAMTNRGTETRGLHGGPR
jgi:hypothetical protein